MSLLSKFKAFLGFASPNASIKPPTTSDTTTHPAQTHFRPHDESSDTVTLPDGRKLGYAQYGSLTGKAILYMHGLPGSRLEGAHFHDIGLELGARIISVERPGMGLSSPQPKRTLLGFAKDVGHLTDHLGLESYAVLGASGGGPSVLACAAGLPGKLKCVSIVCGLGPPDIGMSGAGWMHRLAFPWGYRLAPYWMGRLFWKMDATGRLDLSDEERLALLLRPGSMLQKSANGKDSDIMANKHFLRLSLRSSREAFAQGYDAVWDDGRLMCRDFGFRVQDIRPDLPVQLWYGKYDYAVPVNHGLQVAARLGGGDRVQLRVEDESHAGIFFHWKREIIENLLSKM